MIAEVQRLNVFDGVPLFAFIHDLRFTSRKSRPQVSSRVDEETSGVWKRDRALQMIWLDDIECLAARL